MMRECRPCWLGPPVECAMRNTIASVFLPSKATTRCRQQETCQALAAAVQTTKPKHPAGTHRGR